MKRYIFISLTIFTVFSCKPTKSYDLVIRNATILDVKTGIRKNNQTLLISNGMIEDIVSHSNAFQGEKIIDAKGKLLTPGFIDTHIHPTDVLGDYENAPEFLNKDSTDSYRKKISGEYLPYGTTTVLTMGQPEKWNASLLAWQKKPDASSVDMYISGGAFISKENRSPYIGHTEVATPEKAKQKVLEYYQLGLRHIKLYYRLKEPEFSAVFDMADSLQMKVYGHISDPDPGYITMDQALDAGLINYEHMITLPNNMITTEADRDILYKEFEDHFGEINSGNRLLEFFLEQFRFIDLYKKTETENFINRLADRKASFSTTIHLIYEKIEPTFFTDRKDTSLNPKQLDRCKENFGIMMKYAKWMHEKGIKIRLGSDMPNGGKVNISEMIILAKYGFSIADIFKIATYNGAEALGIENETGSIEKGKKANLILWSQNPFDNYENFRSEITVIKDGKIYQP